MPQKRICHLTSVHILTDTRIFYKEYKTLASAGYMVTLIVQHEKDEVVDGVKIIGLEKPNNRRERMIKTAQQLYNKALECDADLYHFHDPELIPVGLKLKRKGKKVIYDVHEDVPGQVLCKGWIPAPLRRTMSWTIEKIENFGAKRFDYIVTATPYIRNRFLKVNKNTMDINNYPLLPELHISDANWDRKENVVCYIGVIEEGRGIREMVDAIGNTQYSLLLAGDFYTATEREIVVSKDGWSKVSDLGHINRAEVREVLSRSMAGLVLFKPEPNNINAQPNKMFEYMSAGLPVIASDFPLWKEIVEGNNCGICIDALKVEEISNAINWIMEHPAEAEQMGKNGRRAVEAKYNWEPEGKKLIGVYQQLLS